MSDETLTSSVIIPCHNVGKVLWLQLECLALQEGAQPFEVLVVDNCSTDNTRQVALDWKKHLNLRLIEATEHSGVSYARNRGIDAAKTNKLIFIDGDDAIPATYIQYCQRTLDEVPVYVSGFDPVDSTEFALGREHVLSLIDHKVLPYKSPLPSEENPSWPILPGCSFGVKKEVLEAIGSFDLAYEPGAEDNELAFRLIESGYELRVQRSTTIAYRVDPSGNRPFKVSYSRAKSAALLKSAKGAWHPKEENLLRLSSSLLRGLSAVAKSLLLRDNKFLRAKQRFAVALGLWSGYLQYQLLEQKIENRQPR